MYSSRKEVLPAPGGIHIAVMGWRWICSEPRPLMLRRLMPEVALTEGHEVRELATFVEAEVPSGPRPCGCEIRIGPEPSLDVGVATVDEACSRRQGWGPQLPGLQRPDEGLASAEGFRLRHPGLTRHSAQRI